MAKKPEKTGQKKAPSKAQLAARAKFAAMAKSKAVVKKRVASVNARSSKVTKKQSKTSAYAKIPGLGVKPLSKPAYAETDYQTRGEREPVIKDVPKIGYSTSIWM